MMETPYQSTNCQNPQLARRDLDEALRACQSLKNKPFVLLNYLEGTRFTAEKHTSNPLRISIC